MIDAKKRRLIAEDGLHSGLGPSSAERWMNCPGSVGATKNIREPSSTFAASGTASHYLSDICRRNKEKPKKYLGWKILVRRKGEPDQEFEIDQARVDSVEFFIDYVNELPGEQLYEEMIEYEDYVPGGFGTMDHASADRFMCHIVDFKDGTGVQVYAENNPQLKLYALGWWRKYGWLYEELKTFRLHIVQPRLDHTDHWDISLDDLLIWASEDLTAAAVATTKPNAPVVPGHWCHKNFCKIRRTCETRINSVLKDFVGDFTNLDDAQEKLDDIQFRLPEISNEDAGRLLKLQKQTIEVFKDVKSHVMAQLQQGNECGEWKLVRGRSSRHWTQADDDMALILADEMSEDDIWTKKLISPSKAEKIVGKQNALMRSYVEKTDGKPTLAPLDDKRQAMTLDALQDFGNLDAEMESE